MPKRTPPPPRADADDSEDNDVALREVQQYMAYAQTIADGGNPHFSLSVKGANAANKIGLRTGIWSCQPETRNVGIDRALDYYDNGGNVWSYHDSVEVGGMSHEHIHLAATALHLRAGIEQGSKGLLDCAIECLGTWFAAFNKCTYDARLPNGRRYLALLHAGARGRDRRGKVSAEFPHNSCAEKVMQGLLGRGWRKASERFDVAVTLLQKLPASILDRVRGWTDYTSMTQRFGYRLQVRSDGEFCSHFSRLEHAFSPLYGAARVGGREVLAWTQDEANVLAEKFERGEELST